MNDLAEKALQGLDAAWTRVRTQSVQHPLPCFAAAGFLASAGVMVAGARSGPLGTTRALTSWLGIVDTRSGQNTNELPAILQLVAVAVLALLWLGFAAFVRRVPQAEAGVWGVAGAWAAPLALGPPLMDTGVYRNVAYGLLQRAGHDPFTSSPARLGNQQLAAAIDPNLRSVSSAAGPLATLVQHLAVSVSGGGALAAVIVLRVVAVLAAAWIGRLAADMGGTRPDEALSLTIANPLLLLYLVAAAHLDGLMIALVLAAITAANQRRWLASVALGCLAGSVYGQGYVVVPIVVVVHWFGRRGATRWRVLGRDVLAAVVVSGAVAVAVPGHLDWIRTLRRQFGEHPPFSIASAVAKVLAPVVRDASLDDLAAGGRVTAVIAAAATVLYLTATAKLRALERTVGYALLAIALLAPDLRPWYLLWGLLCLAPTANGPRRVWVLALSVTAALLDAPGLSDLASDLVNGVLLALAAGVLAWLFLTGRPSTHEPAEQDALSAGT